jgi:hypothetical protein
MPLLFLLPTLCHPLLLPSLCLQHLGLRLAMLHLTSRTISSPTWTATTWKTWATTQKTLTHRLSLLVRAAALAPRGLLSLGLPVPVVCPTDLPRTVTSAQGGHPLCLTRMQTRRWPPSWSQSSHPTCLPLRHLSLSSQLAGKSTRTWALVGHTTISSPLVSPSGISRLSHHRFVFLVVFV